LYEDSQGTYAVVYATITAELEASPVHVRFEPEGILSGIRQIERIRTEADTCPLDGATVSSSVCSECGYDVRSAKLVGWYHSHPGLTAFMSTTDVTTHRSYFDNSYNISVVVDPINNHYRVWQTDGTALSEIEIVLV
jgi:proteasome lid subunit RPN8/RPN11